MPDNQRRKREFTDRCSDIGRWILISASILLPLRRGNHTGALLAAGSILTATAATKVLKDVADRWRPDGKDTNSFPSEHVAEGFAAASALHRSGFSGTTSFGFAAGIGVGRWHCGEHHVSDIFAGAVLGLATAGLVSRWIR